MYIQHHIYLWFRWKWQKYIPALCQKLTCQGLPPTGLIFAPKWFTKIKLHSAREVHFLLHSTDNNRMSSVFNRKWKSFYTCTLFILVFSTFLLFAYGFADSFSHDCFFLASRGNQNLSFVLCDISSCTNRDVCRKPTFYDPNHFQ